MVKTRSGKVSEEQTEQKGRASRSRPAGLKARNKVAAAKPPKSPELQLQSPTRRSLGASGDGSSLHSGSSVGSGSSTASRPGIPLHIQKQLAADIEAAGGIGAIKADGDTDQAVRKLCDERPEVYGVRGAPLRTKLRKKVYFWRRLDKDGQYVEKVLNRLGVKSAANLKKVAQRTSLAASSSSSDLSDEGDRKRPPTKVLSGNKQKQAKSPSSSSSSQSSSSSSSSGSVQASVPKGPPAEIGFTKTSKAGGKQSSSGPKASRSSRKPTATDPLPSRTDRDLSASNRTLEAAMPTHRSSPPKPSDSEIIIVNVDCPERNREFLVYPAEHIPGAKSDQELYFGYFILIPADNRWYKDSREVEHYKARVFSSNSLMVTVPAFDYTMLHNQDELKQLKSRFPEYAINAIDHACHEYDKNKTSRQYKHYILQFPGDHVLSASAIYEKATEDEYLPMGLHPVTITDDKNKKTKRLYASFTVANEAVTSQKRGKVEHKPKESEGARLLDELESDDDDNTMGMSGFSGS